ncbi:MAG: SPOR domain-containing protein [Ferruginibacter sp.]|nr:SPOR domain-containing protein [Ferruginibacter sp.]
MKKIMCISVLFLSAGTGKSQEIALKDSSEPTGKVTVFKDSRLDILAKKEAEFNEALALGPKSAKGYRLMVLSTNDRAKAMNLRARLLQRFPEQKVYMSFQPPYIKLKFGNFLEKAEADQYKKEITTNKLVTTNIYLVPEIIEIKPDKNKEKEIL